MAENQMIRLPEKLVPEYYKALKKAKSTRKTSTDERNTAVNASMRLDQQIMSNIYKMTAQIDQMRETLKSVKKPAPRGNDVVKTLGAKLEGLRKQVEMLVANRRKSPFDGIFSHGPREMPVEKSVESSIFSSAFAPRDLTEIAKTAQREGYWPLSLKHEPKERSVVVKSSVLDPLEHEEIRVPLAKSASADTNVFDGAFARF